MAIKQTSPRRDWVHLVPKGMKYKPPKGPVRENEHLPKQELYVACEDYDFTWSREDVNKTIRWWKAGMPITTMAEVLGRCSDEIALLIFDLAQKDLIGARHGGIWGQAI